MKKNTGNSSKTKTIINSEINSDAVIHFGKVNFDFAVEIHPSGITIPRVHLEIGENTLHINKEGFDEIRDYFTEEHNRTLICYEQFKADLMKGIDKIPEILELGRCEIDKMDDWEDQRSEKRAKKRGMAYIAKAELDELVQELNELREAQGEKGEKTTEDEEFEDVR
jgi:hypothetical protein